MADDINGVRFIYGTAGSSSATPPTVAPTNVVVVQAPGTVTVSWSPFATPPSATQYRVDFHMGHRDDGSLIASLTVGASPLTVAVPPEVSGAFNVTVTGINGSGVGPTSARTDFVLVGATCSGPPPAVTGVTGGVASGFAQIQWAPSPGATRYLIHVGSTQGAADILGITDLGLHTGAAAPVPAGFRAWVRIGAVNACGVSPVVDFLLR